MDPNYAVSDVLGRLFRSIEQPGQLKSYLAKDGYERVVVSERCVTLSNQDVERNVVMRKQ